MQTSFVRRLNMRGSSLGIALPPEIRRALGLRRGDYVQLIFSGGEMCTISKAEVTLVTDRVIEAAKQPEIIHG